MNPKAQEYIEKIKSQIAKAKTEEKNAFLAEEGLYEKVYSPESDNSYAPDYPHSEWDEKGEITRYYKIKPIEITDDEYEEMKRVYSCMPKPATASGGVVAILFQVIAWATYVAGLIAGMVIQPGGSFSFLVFLASCYAGFVSGTVFLGFGKIIELLSDIRNRQE